MRGLAARHAGWLPAIGAAAILLPGIGQGLWDPWETHYAEVARRIAADGDWVTLRWGSPDSAPAEARHDFHFFSKPALTFWLVAASFHVFGVSEAAARLPIVLLAVAGIAGVFFYLRRIAGLGAALLAAAAMLGAPLYAMLGRHAMTDIPFVAPMTVGTLAFAAVLLDPRTSPNHSYVGYLCLGAATLAKGLLGFLLPGASLLVLLLIMTDYSFLRDRRRLRRLAIGCGVVAGAALAIGWSLDGRAAVPWALGASAAISACLLALAAGAERRRRLRLPTGVPVFLAVCAVWYAPVIATHGMTFVREFLLRHHFERAATGAGLDLSGLDLHDGTAGYYIQQIGYAFFPWIVALPAALAAWLSAPAPAVGGRRSAASGRPDECGDDAASSGALSGLFVLVVAWVAVAYVLFTVSQVKFHHYILPAIPPLAIAVGVGLDRLLDRGAGRAEAAALLLGAALAFLIWRELSDDPNRLIRLITYRYTRPLPEIGWLRVPLAVAFGLALAGVAAAIAGTAWAARRRAAADATDDGAPGASPPPGPPRNPSRLGAVVLTGAMLAGGAVVTLPVLHGAMPETARWISQKDAFAAFDVEPRAEGDRLVSWANNWRGEVFYSGDDVLVIEPRDRRAEAKLRAVLGAPGRVFFVTTDPRGLRSAVERIVGRSAARGHFRVLTPEGRTFSMCLYDGPAPGAYDPRPAAPPADAVPPPGAPAGGQVVLFEPHGPGRLTLVALRLGSGRVRTGGTVRVEIYFRCEAPSSREWETFIHGDAPAPTRRPRVANGDHAFAGGGARTSTCRPGELLLDRWDLEFPAGAPGTYEVFAGLWHAPSGDRMVVDPSTAALSPGAAAPVEAEFADRIYLGAVVLEP